MIDELNQYRPITNDIEILKKQCEIIYACKFLSGLNSQLKPLSWQLLAGEGRFSLCRILSQLSQASESSTTTFDASSVEGFTLVFSTGRGNTSRGHGGMSFRGGLFIKGRVFCRDQYNSRKCT